MRRPLACLLPGAVALAIAALSFGCTETPAYIPPCINPMIDACPAFDAGDAGAESAPADASPDGG